MHKSIIFAEYESHRGHYKQWWNAIDGQGALRLWQNWVQIQKYPQNLSGSITRAEYS